MSLKKAFYSAFMQLKNSLFSPSIWAMVRDHLVFWKRFLPSSQLKIKAISRMSPWILNDTAEVVIDSDAIKESISGNQDDWSDAWTQCRICSTQSRQTARHWEMFWTTQHRMLFVSSVVTNFICLVWIYYDLLRAGDWKALSRIFCYSFLSLKSKQCAVHLKNLTIFCLLKRIQNLREFH